MSKTTQTKKRTLRRKTKNQFNLHTVNLSVSSPVISGIVNQGSAIDQYSLCSNPLPVNLFVLLGYPENIKSTRGYWRHHEPAVLDLVDEVLEQFDTTPKALAYLTLWEDDLNPNTEMDGRESWKSVFTVFPILEGETLKDTLTYIKPLLKDKKAPVTLDIIPIQ